MKCQVKVALRKESVDRNIYVVGGRGTGKTVALRKESVDRNNTDSNINLQQNGSLSARRAWIEIRATGVKDYMKIVALRKESVDRNT